jgi:hypothetical protein
MHTVDLSAGAANTEASKPTPAAPTGCLARALVWIKATVRAGMVRSASACLPLRLAVVALTRVKGKICVAQNVPARAVSGVRAQVLGIDGLLQYELDLDALPGRVRVQRLRSGLDLWAGKQMSMLLRGSSHLT